MSQRAEGNELPVLLLSNVLSDSCLGSPEYIEKDGKRIKNCSNCTFPHKAENYSQIMKFFKGENPMMDLFGPLNLSEMMTESLMEEIMVKYHFQDVRKRCIRLYCGAFCN